MLGKICRKNYKAYSERRIILKATLENIRKRFGIIPKEEKEKEEAEEVSEYSDDTPEYTSHTFSVYKGEKRIGVMSVSDVGDDIRECVGDFLDTVIRDGLAKEDEEIIVKVKETGEKGEGEEVYRGTGKKYRRKTA